MAGRLATTAIPHAARREIAVQQRVLPQWGTVYGTVLNLKHDWDALASAMRAAPYGAPPKAPVLYIKPPNTYTPHGGEVALPATAQTVEAAATLGIVFERDTTRVSETDALGFVAGYTLAIELWLTHADIYRPAVVERCRDGFLPIGPAIVPAHAVAAPERLCAELTVNDFSVGSISMGELVRPIDRLISDISDFMTFSEGDVLLVATPLKGISVSAGDRLSAHCEGFAPLAVSLCVEPESPR